MKTKIDTSKLLGFRLASAENDGRKVIGAKLGIKGGTGPAAIGSGNS